jgi:hypothetical protein
MLHLRKPDKPDFYRVNLNTQGEFDVPEGLSFEGFNTVREAEKILREIPQPSRLHRLGSRFMELIVAAAPGYGLYIPPLPTASRPPIDEQRPPAY